MDDEDPNATLSGTKPSTKDRKTWGKVRKKSNGRRVYQVKGAHDKSYLDISQLRFGKKDGNSDDSDEESDSSGVDASVSQFFQGPANIADLTFSPSLMSSQSTFNEVPVKKYVKSRKFSGYTKPPPIFQGRYGRKLVSDTEIVRKKGKDAHAEQSLTPLIADPSKPKWKFFLEASVRSSIKKRGYYSEVVSPLLRPERIIAARQKEIEDLRKYGMDTEEDEYESEVFPEEKDEFGEDEHKIDIDLLKDWPPIYKVLNPEPALAEFDLPVAYKEPSLISKGRMPKYAPHLENVPAVTVTRNFLQPEENWVVYESEPNVAFPVQAFKPRCYILHVVEPGTLPRKVFIERKRRQYLSQNVEELLAEHGLTDDDLLPPTTSKTEDQFSLYGSSSFLPLEVFDDEGFDPCSVEDWLELGKIDGIQHPIPAVGFVPVSSAKLAKFNIGPASIRYTNKESRILTHLAKEKKLKNTTDSTHYLWMDVAVTHYHYKTNRWAVLTLDGSQTRLYLPRIYVMFRAENPLNFTYRVMDAVLRRRHAEKLIKFNIYCDAMPLDGLAEIDPDTMNRIFKSVTRNGVIKGVDEILSPLANDVQFAHKRILAEISFVHVVKKYHDMFSFIEIPVKETPKVPEKCLKDTKMEDYQGIKKKLKWWWLYVIDETYLGMMHVVTACLKINTMNFFIANFGKYVSLEEFDSMQTGCTNNLVKYLRHEWIDVVVTNVRMCLQDIGKGWFNIKEKSWPIYESSKLCRFMLLIKFRMETALKYLVETSTDLLVRIIESPCLVCLNVPSEDFVWGPDLLNTQFKPATAPIFTMTLKLNNVEAFYTTAPESFEAG